jgi:hypothetical protein
MDYLVAAPDGKEYGPVTLDQLREWVQQDRVRPDTQLKNFHTGQPMPASAVPGLFGVATPPPAANWSQPPAPGLAYAPGFQSARPADDGKGIFFGVIARCALAIVLFFVLHGIGLIFSGYALFYAIQSKANGHKYGIASLAIASVTFVIILIGWVLRLQSGGSL